MTRSVPAASAPLLDAGRLRLLREVQLRGSIAAAARIVGITPSAVSQQLTALERDVAMPLLERSSRGVVLTGAGETLAAHAAALLDVLHAANADLDRLAGSVAGPVRIASVASAAATVVSAALTRLRETAPDVDAFVTAAEPDRGIGMLLGGDAELAVVDEYDYVPLALPDGAVVCGLGDEPLVLVRAGDAGPHSPCGAQDGVALADLADATWVMPPEDAACGRAVRAACRTAGFEPRVRWQTDDMLLLVRAVAHGHGVAVLPSRSVPADAVGVRTQPLRAPGLRRRLLAVARPAVAARPVVDAVLSALGDAAASGS
ncbi:LysR family transcriptional regulator [uncultured Jatrophihabitans sp.]|uniref:LysR family transcriptional regulator n=1 Tax=uncultured Jatrophihabitans sp. TaxID=1610747 RepID=UPI0035CAC1A1